MYKGKPHQTDLVALANIVELDRNKLCVYNATVCTPLLCENYGEGERLTTIKSGFQEVANDKFPPTAERVTKEKEEMDAQAIAEARDLSVREILDLTFGTKWPRACMQANTGGW
jgi:hypothetical protein